MTRGPKDIPASAAQKLATAESRRDASARSFGGLYLFRFGFSVVWVASVLSLAPSKAVGATPSAPAGILLVVYPVSDTVATVFDIRATRAAPRLPQYINLVSGIAAACGVFIAVLSGLAAAITIFGAWAVVSGALQLILAARRRKVLGGQWLMIISGAGSIFAGITFISRTGSSGTGLATLAQYSAGGAIWYLLTAFWLLRSVRSSPIIPQG